MEPVGAWDGANLLDACLKNPISNHRPRGTVGLVQKEGTAVVFDENDALPKIMKKLSRERFLGAPVVRGSDLVGFITMHDIVKYVNGLFFGASEEEWIDYFSKRLDFQGAVARDVMREPDEFNREPPCLHRDFTTFAALEKMARERVHHVVAMDSLERITGIITQSMLVSFLRQTKALWPASFRNLRVADFEGLKGPWRLKTVKNTDTAINAFIMMEDEDVHGLPIVDDKGVLLDCISASDLRGVGSDGSMFYRLYSNVRDFKATVRREHQRLAPRTHYSAKATPVEGVYVTPLDTMETVLGKFDDGNLHRIFVCSAESVRKGLPKVERVISQSDLLFQCLSALIAEGAALRVGSITSAQVPVTTRLRGRKSPGEQKEQTVGGSVVSPARARNIPID